MPPELRLYRTGPEDIRLQPLITELDRYLHAIDGDELHERVSPFNNLEPGTRVVIAEWLGEAVGCGALRSRDAFTGEIKRMFVRPEMRGKRIGQAILTQLEAWAIELGYRRTVLETVLVLESAVKLYTASGYRRIPNYPPYEEIEESACFGKDFPDTLSEPSR